MSSQTRTDEHDSLTNSGKAVAMITHDLSTKMIVIICMLILLLAAAFYFLGQVSSRMTQIEGAVRSNTVATDLAKFNAQEVRIQADTNKQLLTALHARGCKP